MAIKCTVVKKFGIISTTEYDRRSRTDRKKKEHVIKTREVRLVSWNDSKPKLDIREWLCIDGKEDAESEKVATWDQEQLDTLRFILDEHQDELAELEAA